MPSIVSLFSTNPSPIVNSSGQILNFIFLLAEYMSWQLPPPTFYLNLGGLSQIQNPISEHSTFYQVDFSSQEVARCQEQYSASVLVQLHVINDMVLGLLAKPCAGWCQLELSCPVNFSQWVVSPQLRVLRALSYSSVSLGGQPLRERALDTFLLPLHVARARQTHAQ